MTKQWLNYLNLSDDYERRARFLPAVLSLLVLLPLTSVLGLPVSAWLTALVGGTGIAAVLAVGLSHLASAFGNRLQQHLWPRWPHDAPTNQWLRPDDTTRSIQQKKTWYAAIKRLTSLDIEAAAPAADHAEIEALINDAVAQLRNRLWAREQAERLRIHNCDYGFARNLTGLRPVWLIFSVASSAVCWIAYFFAGTQLLWAVTATGVSAVTFVLAFAVLPDYVRRKAHHYAETFFATVLDLDRAMNTARDAVGESVKQELLNRREGAQVKRVRVEIDSHGAPSEMKADDDARG